MAQGPIGPLLSSSKTYAVLADLSISYPHYSVRSDMLLTRSPLRHPEASFCAAVRLACVKHAASVQSGARIKLLCSISNFLTSGLLQRNQQDNVQNIILSVFQTV